MKYIIKIKENIHTITLNEKQEEFLDKYLAVRPLRSKHRRSMYPHLVANNYFNSLEKRNLTTNTPPEEIVHDFINSMMDKKEEYEAIFKAKNLDKIPRPKKEDEYVA